MNSDQPPQPGGASGGADSTEFPIFREPSGDKLSSPDTLTLRADQRSPIHRPDSSHSSPPRIGRYLVTANLGVGGMGVVVLAEDKALGRRVAIKSVRLFGDNPQQYAWMRDRLFREARAAAALSHPGIVGIYDIFEESGEAYIVMEYAGAANLEKAIAHAPPTRQRIVQIIRQTAEALDYAHQHGVVHRDVKPSNLILTDQGQVKVADFGIAKIAESTTQTAKGMVLGTAQYMAPEQFKADRKLDGRADQFALGVIAYKLLTSRVLFPDADSLASLSYKICHEDPARPTSLNPTLPPAVDGIIARALAKDPDRRFPSCTDFARVLEQVLIPPPKPVSSSRRRLRLAALTGAFALLAAAVTFRMVRRPHIDAPHRSPAAPATTIQPPITRPVEQPVAPANHVAIPVPPPRPDKIAKKPKPPAVAKEEPVEPVAKPVHAPAPPPPPAPDRPETGEMVWTGKLDPGAELSIGPGSAGVSGASLPGVPVRLQITPSVVEIVSAPDEATAWKSFKIKNTSSRTQTFFLFRWSVLRNK